MVTIEEAKKLVINHTTPLAREEVAVENALGRALQENIYSPYNQPSFPQSAMDGYAVAFDGDRKSFKLKGETAAGKTEEVVLQAGEARRIFTGAAVPRGADAVIMQEVVTVEGEAITIDTSLIQGQNIRKEGEQIIKGALALEKGHTITSGTVGFLTALGIDKVTVTQKPKITLFVTGNELVKPGTVPAYGEVFESNSYALGAALQGKGYQLSQLSALKDDYEATKSNILQALQKSEVVLLTGGISVGDYDFVGKALQEIGVEEVFYKVMQKPGKPLYFGKYEGTYIFALPGNPAAALTCFYEYVYPCLQKMTGHKAFFLPELRLPLLEETAVKGTRDVFLKGKVTPSGVTILEGQSSFVMKSFADANCLVYLPAKPVYEKGEEVEVHLLF